jgi:hypothetical protein
MGLLRPKYGPSVRRSSSTKPRLRLVWPEPKKGKTTLSVTRQGSLWGPELSLVDNCRVEEPQIAPTNTAAIALLESWMKMPAIDNEFSGSIRRRIDENRLSDRRFFS